MPIAEQVVAVLWQVIATRGPHGKPEAPLASLMAGDDNMHMSTTQNVLGRLQQSVVNPVARTAWDLGVPIPGDALLDLDDK